MNKVLLIVSAILLSSASILKAQRVVEILPDVDTLFICADSSFQLNASTALSYSWSPAAIFDDASSQTPIATPTAPTLVILDAVVNGFPRKDSIFLIPTTPTLSLSSDQSGPVCGGEVVTVFSGDNVQGQGLTWVFPEELFILDSLKSRALVQPLQHATVRARLDITGCIVEEDFTIETIPVAAAIDNPDTVLLCVGEQVELTATVTGNRSDILFWSPAEGLSDTVGLAVTATPEATTTYYTSFSLDGCTIVDSVVVRIDSIPVDLSMEKDEDKETYCQGDVVTLKSPTFNPAAYPIIEHTWSTIDPNPEIGTDPVGSIGFETPDSLYNMVFTAQDSATYRRITTSGGCIDTTEVFIPVIPPKEIIITPDPAVICPGESITLTATFEGEGEITWMPEEVINGPGDQRQVNVGPLMEDTEIMIEVEEQDCPSNASITVQVLPSLIGFNTETVICEGEDIQLNLNSLPGVEYQWSSPDDPSFNSTDPLINVSPTTSTTYTLTAQFEECPEESANLRISVINPVTVDVTPDMLTICPREEFTLSAMGDAAAGATESYTWTFQGSNQNGPDITIRTLTENATFLMTYRALKPNGQECFRATDEAEIIVEQQPEILGFEFNPVDATTDGIFLGESVGVTADIEGSTNGFDFQWMANDDNINGEGPAITDTPADNTLYKLTLTSPNDCVTELTSPLVLVIVPQYQIPNVFTPNDDNVNDFFNIAFVGIQDLSSFITEFKVFNRWGQIVYDNETPETGWDGNVNGNPAPADVYIYKISVRFPDGRTEENSGEVTLIR
ncbi:MAG: gliding motility-associated C-terminal domain-containing protein [Bacteroidota bacterium]